MGKRVGELEVCGFLKQPGSGLNLRWRDNAVRPLHPTPPHNSEPGSLRILRRIPHTEHTSEAWEDERKAVRAKVGMYLPLGRYEDCCGFGVAVFGRGV